MGHVCHGSRVNISKLRLEKGHGAHGSDAPIGASSERRMVEFRLEQVQQYRGTQEKNS